MSNFFGAFEAKTHFSQLIERAMKGEEIFTTRRGKLVANIVPPTTANTPDITKEAVMRFHHLARLLHLGQFDWKEWKSYKDTGRLC